MSSSYAGQVSKTDVCGKHIYDLTQGCGVMSEDQFENGQEMSTEFVLSQDTQTGSIFSAPKAFSKVTDSFLQEVQDSWSLDDLYCDVSAFDTNMDNQMIVLECKRDVLSWAAGTLSASPACNLMLDEAMSQGWMISLEDMAGLDYHLDVPEKRIILDTNGMKVEALGRSEYFRNMMLVSFIRALRDVWQEKRHGAFDEFEIESILHLERVRAADLDVMAVLVAWELRSEGFNALWRHMIGSEEGDIAMRFSGYLERDPSALFNGRALFEAFSQWFRDVSRVDRADHETLNTIDYMVQENGSDVFGHKKLRAIDLEILSCLPDRTAYLQGEGPEILSNPMYLGLGDGINQSHFMQIVHDLNVTRVQDVPFRNADLADKIFPGGEFTAIDDIPLKD